jgi:digeranylgeranylglycerophospholipid reductase
MSDLLLDVVIIGGGPVGSRAAYKLSGMGHRVAVLEKRDGIGLKPCCTGIISQECLNKFEIPSEVVYRNVNSAKIFSPSGEFIRVYRSEPQAAIVNRPVFDRIMAEKAQTQGAEYYLNSQAENVSVLKDRVKIEVLEKGKSRQLEARSAILATGFSSRLVKKLGFGEIDYCVGGVQVEVEAPGVEEVEVYFNQELAPGFFAWLVPTSQGRCLAGLLTRRSPGLQIRNWIAGLESHGKVVVDKDFQVRHSGIPLKPLTRTCHNRLLVVGDAAGQVKPTTGGGIYFGMLCADIAADTLHNALSGDDLSSRNLSNYEREWRKQIEQELRIEYFARRLFEHLSNKQIESMFSRLKSSGKTEALLHDDNFSFDWHGKLLVKVLKHAAWSKVRRLFSTSNY